MNVSRGPGPRRVGDRATTSMAVEQRSRHLAAARVLAADEKDARNSIGHSNKLAPVLREMQ